MKSSIRSLSNLFSVSVLSIAFVAGCSSNPHKAKEVDTKLKNAEEVGQNVTVGQNNSGEVVANRKMKLADQLRDLQREVYEMQFEIYGDEKLGRKGIYTVLRECMDKKGELKRMPSKAILTKAEDKFGGKMVLDESKNLVSVSDEYFLDRIKRFEAYKYGYENQKEDFDDKLRVCKNSKSEE
jgi:hypothetical protein